MSVDVFYKTNFMLGGPFTHLASSRKRPLCGVELSANDWILQTVGAIIDEALCPACAKKRRSGHIHASASGRFTTSVYIIEVVNTSFYKIGISNDVERRVLDLQTGSPLPIRLAWASDPCSIWDAQCIERAMHEKHSARRLTHTGQKEWFELSANEVAELKVLIDAAVAGVRE